MEGRKKRRKCQVNFTIHGHADGRTNLCIEVASRLIISNRIDLELYNMIYETTFMVLMVKICRHTMPAFPYLNLVVRLVVGGGCRHGRSKVVDDYLTEVNLF